ncbi:MAG: glucan biosynthesis protein [Pseudochelatococcus sp.]|jgi:glucans biosynthesis protein|uniref:glucan biosynthesis protein n=1 Tax=Pseudochelatococcus sp. TaxID=2020869 RepID=UPI003D8D9E05
MSRLPNPFPVSRRGVLGGLAAALAASAVMPSPGVRAQAPGSGVPGSGAPEPSAEDETAQVARFGYEDVVQRARELAAVPFDDHVPPLPESVADLDFDAYRNIRFLADRALLGEGGGPFRLQMFHLGFLFRRPVTVSIIRDGVPTPVPYSPQLFDAGAIRLDAGLPINLGFAGFRLHHPLNDPQVFDELISFLGASYFRFLGRGQQYGLSARALAVNAGAQEEFPFFRAFWIDYPAPGAERVTVLALLDGASVTGAFQFFVYPGKETVLDVTATLFVRRPIERLGVAPLTSMYFVGENDRRFLDEYRPELHDSDGLLVHSGSGEWIWRPLRNPPEQARSSFIDNNIRGFGLLQRDRNFEHYQDIDLHYELRPGYWVEPVGDWGPGHVELLEIPTNDETNDNIVAFWVPRETPQAGQTLVYRYRVRAVGEAAGLHPGGRAINTYQGRPKAAGSAEEVLPGMRRFLVDFAGDDLAYHMLDPSRVAIDASVSKGRVVRTFLVANPKIKGFRAGIDIAVPPGETVDVRAFLREGGRALTETWIHPWTAR